MNISSSNSKTRNVTSNSNFVTAGNTNILLTGNNSNIRTVGSNSNVTFGNTGVLSGTNSDILNSDLINILR